MRVGRSSARSRGERSFVSTAASAVRQSVTLPGRVCCRMACAAWLSPTGLVRPRRSRRARRLHPVAAPGPRARHQRRPGGRGARAAGAAGARCGPSRGFRRASSCDRTECRVGCCARLQARGSSWGQGSQRQGRAGATAPRAGAWAPCVQGSRVERCSHCPASPGASRNALIARDRIP